MSRINPVNPEHTDVKTAATLQAVKKKLGVLPNIFTTFAQSPAALNGYVQLGECLAGGRLTARHTAAAPAVAAASVTAEPSVTRMALSSTRVS